ncbi:hypothetical protein WJ0W_006209 [Paenibacillus melissococcoides]|uniref:Single-stranded DNA-binding protein n=1 Tax=Paenibacillus melissococcoides TaxID=2912268 RepID=A0ABN8UCU7_9BACL|nr:MULTISPECIES: hypothetical protein [Paenibacillus]CAH8246856.1 hypothetical protein WJ0W_004088 [Paenibacillus melissococcoides]CAH8249022.1 hypothetical protein WJ0W_006209 [Paenibacillus melissococcoides]CAH8710739.1 hypothetical protein HTL2_002733 [Paenibacillus melissococcoides]CAH8715963.1 hypothetical protein HTL2_004458 [Paenibacillus melissococcoides]CAH8716917.1 hypothetical protein WDD9_004725 [Paenibacillus melissococcoides]
MRFPFPKWNQVTPVKVYQTELSEDGEPVEDLIFDGLCCYDEKSRQVLDAERRLVLLSGLIVIEGDIRPGKTIEGFVEIGTEQKNIFRTRRPRNPDGSVFSTELELM